jgi:hypothetical protein
VLAHRATTAVLSTTLAAGLVTLTVRMVRHFL